MNRPLPQRLLAFLAPGVLVLVACVQMTFVRTHDLTPWKGGGFGMFSTLDSQVTRALRVVLLTEEGEAVVALPNLNVRKERLLNMPDDDVLRGLAAHAVGQEWIVYTYDELREIKGDLPAEFRRQMARIDAARREAAGGEGQHEDSTIALPGVSPALIAFPYARRSLRIEGERPAVLGARAEVWRLLFDAESDRLHEELINDATVEVAR
jgi:hypothetical protein